MNNITDKGINFSNVLDVKAKDESFYEIIKRGVDDLDIPGESGLGFITVNVSSLYGEFTLENEFHVLQLVAKDDLNYALNDFEFGIEKACFGKPTCPIKDIMYRSETSFIVPLASILPNSYYYDGEYITMEDVYVFIENVNEYLENNTNIKADIAKKVKTKLKN